MADMFPNPRNSAFAPQSRMQSFNRRALDQKYQGMDNARTGLAARNARVYDNFGRPPGDDMGGSRLNFGQIDDAVADRQRQVGRNFMSSRDRRMVDAPIVGEPINGRSVFGEQPGSTPAREAISNAQHNLNQKSFTRQFNAAHGIGPAPAPAPRDTLNDYASIEKDKRIIGNARKYGLDANAPAVAMALDRFAKRGAPQAAADAAQAEEAGHAKTIKTAMIEHHVSHAAKLAEAGKHEEAAKYLSGVMKMLTQPKAGPAAAPAPAVDAVEGVLQRGMRGGQVVPPKQGRSLQDAMRGVSVNSPLNLNDFNGAIPAPITDPAELLAAREDSDKQLFADRERLRQDNAAARRRGFDGYRLASASRKAEYFRRFGS